MAVALASLGQHPSSVLHFAITDLASSFESRESCDEVIRVFNNHTIESAGEELSIQIRFADTQEQKSLKQQTQAARQFRSAEYEYATQAWRQGRLPFAGTTTQQGPSNGNEFEQYLGTNAGVPIQGQRWAQSAIRQMPGRSPLGAVPYNSAMQPPTVQIKIEPGNENKAQDVNGDAKPSLTTTTSVQVNSPVDSATASEQE